MAPRRIVPAAASLVVLVSAVALGPRAKVQRPPSDPVDVPASGLDAWLRASEAAVPNLREGHGKEIVWAGDPDVVTDLSVVYLHGFSADRHELDPVPREVARALDANLFFARLAGHARDGAAMGEVRPEDWLRDAQEAIAIGRRIGRRVVVVGTSTGGTLATWVAGQETWRDVLHAVVMISPNYGLRDGRSRMLLWPWGAAIGRVVAGPERCFEPSNPEQAVHWTTCYPTGALPPMMALVEHVRTMDPARVEVPVLILYSPRDEIVDPDETERLFAGFASTVKRMVPVDGNERGQHHVLAGDILSPETNESVVRLMLEFLGNLAEDTP